MSGVEYQGVGMIGAKTGVVSVLLGIALALGCAGGGAPHPEEPPLMEKADYVIGAGDVLTVRVWKNVELSVDVPVRPDGKISVPLLDDVQAEGFTALELKEVITRDLAEYVSNPDVTVVVKSIGSKHIYVLGEVVRSGPILLSKDLRVLDAVSMAGGFSAFANKKKVKIIRRTEDGEVEYRFNYDAYVAGKAPGTNMLLVPDDTIVVPD